jgi:hypothetical protein
VFHYELAVQSDANQRAVVSLLENAAAATSFDRLRGAFAYASVGGAQLAAWGIRNVSGNWEAMEKRWLISLDWGHTDPDALEFLASLPRSSVRIPNADVVLRRNLVPATCFHPKTAIFDRGRVTAPVAIVVGSANLTVSGLETGHEHAAAAIWLSGRLSRDAAAQLAAMAEQGRHADRVWRTADRLTPARLADYARRRRRIRSRNEDASGGAQSVVRNARGAARRFEIPLNVSAQIASARSMWVDITYVTPNRGVGVPGNQVDLQRGTRLFFGFSGVSVPRNTILGDVVIRYRGHVSTHHMRYGNNQMDKLNLPIPGAGGPPGYSQETLIFEKRPDGSFDLRLGSPTQVRQCKAASRREGTLFTMQGGRQWGVSSN